MKGISYPAKIYSREGLLLAVKRWTFSSEILSYIISRKFILCIRDDQWLKRRRIFTVYLANALIWILDAVSDHTSLYMQQLEGWVLRTSLTYPRHLQQRCPLYWFSTSSSISGEHSAHEPLLFRKWLVRFNSKETKDVMRENRATWKSHTHHYPLLRSCISRELV